MRRASLFAGSKNSTGALPTARLRYSPTLKTEHQRANATEIRTSTFDKGWNEHILCDTEQNFNALLPTKPTDEQTWPVTARERIWFCVLVGTNSTRVSTIFSRIGKKTIVQFLLAKLMYKNNIKPPPWNGVLKGRTTFTCLKAQTCCTLLPYKHAWNHVTNIQKNCCLLSEP